MSPTGNEVLQCLRIPGDISHSTHHHLNLVPFPRAAEAKCLVVFSFGSSGSFYLTLWTHVLSLGFLFCGRGHDYHNRVYNRVRDSIDKVPRMLPGTMSTNRAGLALLRWSFLVQRLLLWLLLLLFILHGCCCYCLHQSCLSPSVLP